MYQILPYISICYIRWKINIFEFLTVFFGFEHIFILFRWLLFHCNFVKDGEEICPPPPKWKLWNFWSNWWRFPRIICYFYLKYTLYHRTKKSMFWNCWSNYNFNGGFFQGFFVYFILNINYTSGQNSQKICLSYRRNLTDTPPPRKVTFWNIRTNCCYNGCIFQGTNNKNIKYKL